MSRRSLRLGGVTLTPDPQSGMLWGRATLGAKQTPVTLAPQVSAMARELGRTLYLYIMPGATCADGRPTFGVFDDWGRVPVDAPVLILPADADPVWSRKLPGAEGERQETLTVAALLALGWAVPFEAVAGKPFVPLEGRP